MSQEQPRRPKTAIDYGDIFDAQGNLASKPIAPQDAATMQSAESRVLGQNPRGGPASVMQSAARLNERAGAVPHDQAADVVRDQGITFTDRNNGGTRVVTERVAGEIVAQYMDPRAPGGSPGPGLDITIGEALEATAYAGAGDKPIDQGDAAAIQAVEVRATGSTEITPGGVASQAQSAAELNPRYMMDEDKTTLSDVLSDASSRLPSDKAVTIEIAQGAIGEEIRNKPSMRATPGGVAASMAGAARLKREPVKEIIL